VSTIAASLDANDPEAILTQLHEPIRALQHSMDDGVSFADGVMDEQPWNPHVWATLVRYRALNLLVAAEKDGWWLGSKLPNCGIAIQSGQLTGRLLKSQGGGPPAPGRNVARRRYWSQYRQLGLPLETNEPIDPSAGANLIFDWDVTEDREVLLALSKPVGLWKYRGEPELEWRLPIMIADTGLSFEGRDDEDVSVEPKYDLGELEQGSGE
jgi:hypothetical protein